MSSDKLLNARANKEWLLREGCATTRLDMKIQIRHEVEVSAEANEVGRGRIR